MTKEEKSKVLELRNKGLGYKAISNKLNIPISSISSFCKRNETSKLSDIKTCKNCGGKLIQTKGHRQKIFCSDKCRRAWWKGNPSQRNLKAYSECTCELCHKPFIAYANKTRKYCSWNCYLTARQGGGLNE